MICEDGFVFRKGKKYDKQPSGYIPFDENDIPDFVLELNGNQVVAAKTIHGKNHIYMISSFEQNKGYCTKFLGLWEKYATEKGYSELIVSYVDSDALEHILEKKRLFIFERRSQQRKDLPKRHFISPQRTKQLNG